MAHSFGDWAAAFEPVAGVCGRAKPLITRPQSKDREEGQGPDSPPRATPQLPKGLLLDSTPSSSAMAREQAFDTGDPQETLI